MADRPNASTVTDDQLEALYAEQEALLKATADLISDIGYARTTLSHDVLGWAGARDDMNLRQTVSYAVAEHRSDLARAARAERAEQQAAQVRAVLAEVLAQFTHNTHPGTPCKQTGHVNVATIDRWHTALDAAGQPDTPAGECGYVDGDRRCIGRPGHDNPRLVHGPWVTHTAQHARENGHTAATGATGATDAPGADDHANGPHAGAQGREVYRAAFQRLLPETAWHLAGALADTAAGIAAQQHHDALDRTEDAENRYRNQMLAADKLIDERNHLEAELEQARRAVDRVLHWATELEHPRHRGQPGIPAPVVARQLRDLIQTRP